MTAAAAAFATIAAPHAQALPQADVSHQSSAPAVGRWTGVAAGYLHTCGSRSDGTLWCWGYGFYGQLGDGAATSRSRPVQVGAETSWATVSGGIYHTCGTRTDGTLWCWGRNAQGQLGDGSFDDRSTPTQVGTATTWTSVVAAGYHTCGTQSDGTLWCWGSNRYGEVGDGTKINRVSPVQITGTTWATVAGGTSHSCATRTDGTLWCWGQGRAGQLGDGTGDLRVRPVRVGSDADWRLVFGGSLHTCATRNDGSLWCWGNNRYGQVGDGTRHINRLAPVQVGTAADWVSAAGGGWHTCATRVDGTLWCWGWNYRDQLGDPTDPKYRKNPHQVGHKAGWRGPSGGRSHSCATRVGGALLCWGDNGFAQLGDGTTRSRPEPRRVTIP